MVKQFVDSAVSMGRRYQSPETGMLHFSEQGTDPNRHDLIPLYENFLFALALFKARTSETVEEGRALLARILNFQTETGGFPQHLHEFPEVRGDGVRLLHPLYLLLTDEATYLGKTASERTKEAAVKLLRSLKESEPKSFVRALLFAASLIQFGKLFSDSALTKQGDLLLEKLSIESKDSSFGSWYSPELIGETYLALQLLDSDLGVKGFEHFLPFVEESFARAQQAFALPAVKIEQRGSEPAATLYDLMIGQLTGNFSYRAFDSLPFQLKGGLFRASSRELKTLPLPFHKKRELAGCAAEVWQEPNFSAGALALYGPIPSELKRFFQPFRLLFGSEKLTHSLALQGGRLSRLETVRVENGFDLDIWIMEEPPQDDREKSHELIFFVDRMQDLSISLGALKATTFQLGDKVEIKTPNETLSVSFHHLEGDGRFMGHITPGNRPSQLLGQVGGSFEAFDWMIYLRTVRRTGAQHLKVEIRLS